MLNSNRKKAAIFYIVETGFQKQFSLLRDGECNAAHQRVYLYHLILGFLAPIKALVWSLVSF